MGLVLTHLAFCESSFILYWTDYSRIIEEWHFASKSLWSNFLPPSNKVVHFPRCLTETHACAHFRHDARAARPPPSRRVSPSPAGRTAPAACATRLPQRALGAAASAASQAKRKFHHSYG